MERYWRLRETLAEHANDIIADLGPMDAAIDHLDIEEHGSIEWRIEINDLTLRLDEPPRGAYPSGCKLFAVRLSLDFRSSIDNVSNSVLGTMLALSVQVSIEATRGLSSHRLAWHLDMHNYPLTATNELHPLVHWQHGGHSAKAWNIDIGSWLLTAAPRLAAPPVDAVLAIDWLLAHYAANHWRYLRDVDTKFAGLLREHQTWLWKPYFTDIASHWTSTPAPTRHDWWPDLFPV
jgi:hypothetical protein